MILKIIVFLLLAGIWVDQIVLIRKLRVATKKSLVDNTAFVIGMLIIVWVIYRYASHILDYAFAVIGISAFVLNYFKQGVAVDGISMVARGLETYKWAQISYAKIEESEDIRITYFSNTGSPLIKQKYSAKSKERLLDILGKNVKLEDMNGKNLE